MQRALTIKILVILFLTLLMLIPLGMIKSKILERDNYRIAASQSVANSWTGEQSLMTPIIVIPYSFLETKQVQSAPGWRTTENRIKGYKIIAADNASVKGNIITNTLMRGIYKIPVFESELSISTSFSKEELTKALADIHALKGVNKNVVPYLSVFISDSRGIQSTPDLYWNEQPIAFSPGSKIPTLSEGIHTTLPLSSIDSNAGKALNFNLVLNLKGKETLNFIPAGNQVDIGLDSPWPHPEFIGSFLPDERSISEHGFSANWHVTQFSSNINHKIHQCESQNCTPLRELEFGVNLIDPVDIYLQSERSIKYGILFIGLSFISFFLFENLKKIRIHPIQYGLIGLSIATFYLLLISLSEHIHFGLAYLIATIACASIIFAYLKFVLAGSKNAAWFAAGLTALYAILYVIIQAEDFALLMGAILVFTMLCVIMMITKNINWYEVSDQLKPDECLEKEGHTLTIQSNESESESEKIKDKL